MHDPRKIGIKAMWRSAMAGGTAAQNFGEGLAGGGKQRVGEY